MTALSSPLHKINKCYNQHQIFGKKVYINTSGDVLALPESCPNVTKMVFFSQRIDKANWSNGLRKRVRKNWVFTVEIIWK